MYKAFLKNVIMPLMDVRSQTGHVRCLEFLEKTQWLLPAQLQEIQNQRLRALLKHAYETVPFYRERFRKASIRPEDIRSAHELARLPRLTKEEIRKNLQNLISTQISGRKLTPFATGGSTGVPLKFFKDKRTTSWAYAATSRSYRWAGLDLGDKYMILWSSPFDLSTSRKLEGSLHQRLMRYYLLSSSEMSDESMSRYVGMIRKYKPKALKGYTSSLVLLAHYLEEHETARLNLRSVISTAETLHLAERKLIEEQFHCPVYDTYGSREIALMAGECEQHTGLHVSAETAVLEFVKEDEHVAAGELGELLVTDLQNYGMPLIRYAIGDAGRPDDAACPCGRGLPLIKAIDGRVTDYIRAGDGRYVPGPAFIYFFSDLPVKKYQIVQNEIKRLIIKVVTEPSYQRSDDEKIVQRIQSIVGEETEIHVEHVDQIMTSETSGKFLPIFSKLSPFTRA